MNTDWCCCSDKEGVSPKLIKEHLPSDANDIKINAEFGTFKVGDTIQTVNQTYDVREIEGEWSYVGMMGKLRM